MYQSAKCQECGCLFERAEGSLSYCADCLEGLDAEAQELAREAELPPPFEAQLQDRERNENT